MTVTSVEQWTVQAIANRGATVQLRRGLDGSTEVGWRTSSSVAVPQPSMRRIASKLSTAALAAGELRATRSRPQPYREVTDLGPPDSINAMFSGFQRHLYAEAGAAAS